MLRGELKMSEKTRVKHQKTKVLIYGDEAIDTHLLIDNESPETVLNDKLNGQSVRMITDRTGHRLIGELIEGIHQKIYGKIDDVDIRCLCSCSEKANFAYYMWKKTDTKLEQAEYYKDLFIGAKFDWIAKYDKETFLNDNRNYDMEQDEEIDVLIFYNRHYKSEGCKECESYIGTDNEKSCIYNSKRIMELLKNQTKAPVIFIRTANEVDNSTEDVEKVSQQIIKLINDNEKLRKNTIVLTKLNDLKGLGAELPVKYSWEDLIRSTYRELLRIRKDSKFEKNGMLISAPLIIVDFNYDGYAVFDFSRENHLCTMVYNKSSINGDGFKQISKKGSIPSSTSILQAIVADFTVNEMKKQDNPLNAVKNEIVTILKICYLSIYYYCSVGRELQQHKHEDGTTQTNFCVDKDSVTSFVRTVYQKICKPQKLIDDKVQKEQCVFIEKHMPGVITLDDSFLREDSNLNFYDVIINDNTKYKDTYELCEKIIKEGLSKTELPYVCFGKLLSIDVQEIKNYRHIYKLMQNKIENPLKDRKPLSFCVFGKPGAGKSFGVKQIAENITGKKDNVLTFNLSQMNSVDDLYNAFVKISDFVLENKVPIVFWDEFDSPFEGKKYGWLKYFLAPMEDGEYFYNNVSHNVGSCVFIFAGSNVHSWSAFINLTKDSTESKLQKDDTDLSKISDFISRILGYIDVLGPNPETEKVGESTKVKNDNEAYKLRRAIFVRQNIETIYDVKKDEKFFIDNDLLRTLIEVTSYKHGNRSLANLIKQFKINGGDAKHIKKYCIPNQLELYVEEESWNRLIGTKSTTGYKRR